MLTPFEKNLEVWRQLWRVLERSHIVVQVLYHSPRIFIPRVTETYTARVSLLHLASGNGQWEPWPWRPPSPR